MAVDMFLKIDGLDGESADGTHGKEIDVLSWDFGVSQSGTLHIATGGGAGKASFSDLLVEKFVDSATTNLFGAVAKGKHFGSAVLTVRKAGDTPLEYLKYEMTEVMITSYKSGAVKEESDERVRETVALNFAKVKLAYKPQKPDGTAGGEMAYTFNIAKNEKE